MELYVIKRLENLKKSKERVRIKTSRSWLLLTTFFITAAAARNVDLEKIPIQAKILVLIVSSIFLIWIIFKYSKPDKAKKYRIMAFTSAGMWFVITAIVAWLKKYYYEIFQEYHGVFTVLVISSLILAVIVTGLCSYKVKMYEDD